MRTSTHTLKMYPIPPVKSYYKGWGGVVGWGAVVASRRKEGVKIWRLSVALVTFC